MTVGRSYYGESVFWRNREDPRTRADLSEESGFFLDLLDAPTLWRERVVQELQFSSRTHVRLTSSYQLDFPPELLQNYVDLRKIETANVLLPLTRREKAPLLNFSLTGPGDSPVALTSRASTGALQAQYLSLLEQTSAAKDALKASMPAGLYEAIGLFTPGRFDDFLTKAKGAYVSALTAYLTSGVALTISESDVQHWIRKTALTGQILANRLNEPASRCSCSEQPLLALPNLDVTPTSVVHIDQIIDGYCEAVEAADRADDEFFLVALADYGRRYDMIVEVEVPLLEPSTIKIVEDLPLELSRRNWISHRFAFGESRSGHLEARTLDSAVEIADFGLRDLQGGDASGWIESVRRTGEAISIYSSEPERPYYVDVRLRFRAARHLLVTTVGLVAVSLATLAVILLVEKDRTYVDRLAVLSIPTTVATAFFLIREQTTLATRVQQGVRATLATTTLALWAAVLAGLFTYDTNANGSTVRPVRAPESQANRGYHGIGKDRPNGEERSTRQRTYRGRQGP